MHSAEQEKWYIRQHGELVGPFPAVQIARYLILQRLTMADEISVDCQRWYRIGDVAEVQPAKLETTPAVPAHVQAQLAATRRWVHEHPGLFQDVQVSAGEGVLPAAADYQAQILPTGLNRKLAYGMAAMLGVGVVLVALILPQTMAPALPECDAAPGPGVNWSNCLLQGIQLDNADLRQANMRNALLGNATMRAANLEGADLAYADLSLVRMRGARLVGANLTGANLRNADLQASNLQDADLSYANLIGVEWRGANLEGVRLGYAIWNEEFVCMPESVGQCIFARPQ